MSETEKKAGRPSNADLAAREAELKQREDALEAEMKAREDAVADREEKLEARGTRQPVTTGGSDLKGRDSKSQRKGMGQAKRLNADKYLLEYPEHQLMWVNDTNGDVERWLDEGAEPVPVQSKAAKEYKGLTDRRESEWVRAIGGDDGMGGHFWVYLLKVERQLYAELVTEPEQDRLDLIKRAMHMGRDQSDDNENRGLKLPSYAPNLPTGGTGFAESTG